MGLRDDHRARTLHGIQRAALALVEENGLAATTMAQIADAAGISERTVFRYCSSKEDAVLPGQRRFIEELVARPIAGTEPAAILTELLGASRDAFAVEISTQEFRRISRLLVSEPDLIRMVSRQERDLVAALNPVIGERPGITPVQAQVIAELVSATWRIAWQCSARAEHTNPVEVFDETVRELRALTGAVDA